MFGCGNVEFSNFGGHGGGRGRGIWCGSAKINLVCWTGVGDGGVELLGMDTM